MSKEIKLKFTYYDEGKDLYTFETDKGGKVICKCVKPAIIRTLGAVVKDDFKTNTRFMCVINETTTPGLFWINECIKFDKKVQKTLDVSADEVDSMIDNSTPKEVVITPAEAAYDKPIRNINKDNMFNILNKVKCKVDKKGRFNYISWANAWKQVKTLYPKANYRVITYDREGKGPSLIHPISKEGGGFVLVQVDIDDLVHEEYFPILNNINKPIKYDMINAFDVNTSIKRGLAKCLALHGIGLYVFEGEDLPEE